MSRYNEKLVRKLYKKKKLQCEDRMIPFDFNIEQWVGLYKLCFDDNNLKCAYTNHHFDFSDNQLKPSLERLDSSKGYSIDNCVFVCLFANTLKEKYIEIGEDESLATPDERRYLVRIKRIVESVDNIQRIQEPYKHLFNVGTPKTLSDEISIEPEQSIEQQQKTSVTATQERFEHNKQDIKGKEAMTTNSVYIPSNPEISTARKYAEFGEFIERVCGSEFGLTYVQFATKLRRKTCSLTNKPIETQGYFISDKTKAISKETFYVVEKSVGEQVDKLMTECNIDFKTMKTLCKNFGKM